MDNRLRINAAAYYSDYKNIQQTAVQLIGGVNVQTLRNFGAGRIYGAELEVTALFGDLQIDAALAVTDPKYTKGPGVGFPFINIAKTTWGIGANYPLETSIGKFGFNANYSWRSKVYFATPIAAGSAPNLTQDGYGLVDARITLDLADAPVTLAIYGQNLADKKYDAVIVDFTNSFGYTLGVRGAPRTVGASVKYRF